jgi:membrane fusion protein (multidrug efflux system)
VSVVEAGQKTIPVYSEYVGQTYGESDVEIRPRVDGWVKSIHFKKEAPVHKGQLLYVIQDDELRDREQAAQAQLAQANIMLVKAKSDLDRVKPLVEMNALAKRDLDAAQASYDAQATGSLFRKGLVKQCANATELCKILAPITGTIGVSNVQVGDYVKNLGQPAINTISAGGRDACALLYH